MRFRYYLDFGSGYQLVNVYNNNLRLNANKKVSLAIESKDLEGDITLIGIEANQAFGIRTTGYYIPFKIEENVNNTWHLLYECYADIRGEYLYQSKLLKIKNFKSKSTIYDKILSGLENKFTLLNNIPFYSINQNVTSKRLDIYSIPTDLTAGEYILNYTLEGDPISVGVSGAGDTRWTNFRYYSTSGTSPNLIHKWSIQSFDYLPGVVDGWNGYEQMTINGITYWVKNTPPPTTYADETFNTWLVRYAHSFSDIFNYIINGLDTSISFLQSQADQININGDYFYLAYSDEFNLNDIKEIQISLKDIFDFMLNFYNNAWYIDNGYLKFKRMPHTLFNQTLDLSTKQIDKDKITFAYEPMPDKEIWKFQDDSVEKWLISYFQKNILTNDVTFEYISPFLHDFFHLKKKMAQSSKFVFFQYQGGIVIPKNITKDFYDLYASNAGYSEYPPFYVKADASLDYGNIRADSYDTRPIYAYKFDINLQSYYNFDLFQKITFANGNTGYLNDYSINLKNGIATFNVYFDTLNF